MATRYYDRELECGCLVSSDAGGCCMPCFSDDCKYGEWMKTEDYKEFEKECEENNN